MRVNAASLLAAALLTMLAGLLTGSAFAGSDVNGGTNSAAAATGSPAETIDCTPRNYDPRLPVDIAGGRASTTFTIPADCAPIELSYASYKTPWHDYVEAEADQEVLYDSTTVTLGPGTHTLSVALPNNDATCFYQADFVYGKVIEKFGPVGTDNFYRAQNRMIAADSGGEHSCLDTPPPTTTTTTTTPTTTTTTTAETPPTTTTPTTTTETPPTTTTPTTTAETPPATTTTTPPPSTTPPEQAGVAGVQTALPTAKPKPKPKAKAKAKPTTTAEVAGTPATQNEGAGTAAPALDTTVKQSGSLPFTGLPLGLFGLSGLLLVGAGALFLRAARDGRP